MSKGKPKDEKPKVPGYIVTFSDMVTLLLTFFVLLLSLATEQDPALFDIGRDSFREAINGCGLGMLMGRSQSTEFGNIQIKYRVENAEQQSTRTIDEEEEKLKRQFQELNKSVSTMPSQIVAQQVNFSISDIQFPPASSTLNQSAEKFLTDFARNMRQQSGKSRKMIYVLGLANDQRSNKANLVLSAKRARSVANFLKNNLSSADQWDIYSWGGGSGGDWVNSDSPVSAGSDICIAVLTE